MPEVQPPAAQDVSNILRVVEAKKPKKACGSGQKQQSSLGSRKERTVPSTKSDSFKSQAGKRSNLAPVISNSATVQKSVNGNPYSRRKMLLVVLIEQSIIPNNALFNQDY